MIVIYLSILLNTLIHISNYYLQQFMCLSNVFLYFLSYGKYQLRGSWI